MGLGRREFIRLLGTTVVGLTLDPGPAIALLGNVYVNRKLGIAFQKPQGWFFNHAEAMGNVKDGQVLALDDPDLAEFVRASTELPIVSISEGEVSAQSSRFTPGINLYVQGYVDPPDVLVLAEEDSCDCQDMLRDFQVLAVPERCTLSHCPASETLSAFLFEHKNMPTPVRVRMRTLLVHQPPRLYTIRMYDSPYHDMAFDYDHFRSTIWIV